jgi:hypothetical protein
MPRERARSGPAEELSLTFQAFEGHDEWLVSVPLLQKAGLGAFYSVDNEAAGVTSTRSALGEARVLAALARGTRGNVVDVRAQRREETRRQRLKVFLAHLKLTRLHVVFARHADTHASICTVFDLCESHAEHLFVLTFAHTLLSEMAYTPGVKELPLTRQLVRVYIHTHTTHHLFPPLSPQNHRAR